MNVRPPPSFSLATRRFAIVLLAMAAAGCATPPTSYDLPAPTDVRAGRLRATIAVGIPEADEYLDSDRIVVRSVDGAISVLSSAQWAERLGDLVQSRLVRSFENAGLAKQVVAFGAPSRYVLGLEIKNFELDASKGEARVTILARIVSGAHTVSLQSFTATAPAPVTGGGAGPRALGEAAQNVFGQIVRWTVSRI